MSTNLKESVLSIADLENRGLFKFRYATATVLTLQSQTVYQNYGIAEQ